jgi:manganese transport protein
MAGQTIMQDFVGFRTPLWLRRLVTMLPAVVVVALGVNATQALVGSQVVLSLVLPVPMIALLVLAGRRDIMGTFVVRGWTRLGALVAAVLVLALNLILLLQTVGVPITLG